jgi:hypothetical protein
MTNGVAANFVTPLRHTLETLDVVYAPRDLGPLEASVFSKSVREYGISVGTKKNVPGKPCWSRMRTPRSNWHRSPSSNVRETSAGLFITLQIIVAKRRANIKRICDRLFPGANTGGCHEEHHRRSRGGFTALLRMC